MKYHIIGQAICLITKPKQCNCHKNLLLTLQALAILSLYAETNLSKGCLWKSRSFWPKHQYKRKSSFLNWPKCKLCMKHNPENEYTTRKLFYKRQRYFLHMGALNSPLMFHIYMSLICLLTIDDLQLQFTKNRIRNSKYYNGSNLVFTLLFAFGVTLLIKASFINKVCSFLYFVPQERN